MHITREEFIVATDGGGGADDDIRYTYNNIGRRAGIYRYSSNSIREHNEAIKIVVDANTVGYAFN